GGVGRATAPTNAKAETLATSRLFQESFRRGRCLVPADGFYEWQAVPGQKRKQPYYVKLRDGLFAFAGLWTPGRSATPASCTIITTPPHERLAGHPPPHAARREHPRPPHRHTRSRRRGSLAGPARDRHRASALVPAPDARRADGRLPGIEPGVLARQRGTRAGGAAQAMKRRRSRQHLREAITFMG